MDFVNRLKPSHFAGFWYFASRVNFSYIGTFGSLLWATAPAQEEADFYKTRLREYRWTLSVSARRAPFLDFAVTMLDTKQAMLSNLAAKPSIAECQALMQERQAQDASIKAARRLRGEEDDTVMQDMNPSGLGRFTSGAGFEMEMEMFEGEEGEAMEYVSDDFGDDGSQGTPPSSV
jgi:hypothetical protein